MPILPLKQTCPKGQNHVPGRLGMSQEMMKAAVLAGPQKIEIRQIPVPAVEPGMMKIRVSACGVCGSDIHMWKAGKGWNPQSGSELLHGPRVLRRGCGPGRQQLLHWRQSHILGQSLLRDLRHVSHGQGTSVPQRAWDQLHRFCLQWRLCRILCRQIPKRLQAARQRLRCGRRSY